MCCMCSTNLYVDENFDVIDERIFVFRRTFSEGWRCDVHIRHRDSKSFVDSSGIRDSRRGRLADMTCGLAVGLHHVTTVHISRRGGEVRRTRVIGGR